MLEKIEQRLSLASARTQMNVRQKQRTDVLNVKFHSPCPRMNANRNCLQAMTDLRCVFVTLAALARRNRFICGS